MQRFGPGLVVGLSVLVLCRPHRADAQVQVDLTGVFTGDYVRNTGDTVDSAMDQIGTNLVTEAIAGSGLGLPDNGEFGSTTDHPEIQIAATDSNNGNNAIFLTAGQSVTVTVPSGRYSRLQVYSLATEGRASAELVATYSDGTTTMSNVTIPDWFDDPPPAGFFYIIDGMNRFSTANGTVETVADPAVFGFNVSIDSSKSLTSLRLRNSAAGQPRWVILGITGETVGAIATDDTYVTNEDQVALTNAAAGLLANDMILDGGVATAQLSMQATNGSVVLNTDGSFSYTPRPDFFGMDEFTYEVRSSNGGRDTATVRLVVQAQNDPPVARPDTFGLLAPGRSATLELLGNDDDGPDVGETLSLVGVSTASAGGLVTVVSDSAVEYTSDSMFEGVETFIYTLGDGTPGSVDTATVTVNVGLPMGLPDTYTVLEDETLTVSIDQGVLVNDEAGDDRGLAALLLTPTQNGMLTLRTDGSFTYIPDANYFGEDSFTYESENSAGGRSGPVNVTITVEPQNDPPTAIDDEIEVLAGQEVTVDVLANDSSAPDGNEMLRVVLVESPSAGGSAEVSADGLAVIYTSRPDFEGTETMAYTIDDGNPTSLANAVVTATVAIDMTEEDAGTAEPDAMEVPLDAEVEPADAGMTAEVGMVPPDDGDDGCRCTRKPTHHLSGFMLAAMAFLVRGLRSRKRQR